MKASQTGIQIGMSCKKGRNLHQITILSYVCVFFKDHFILFNIEVECKDIFKPRKKQLA